MTRVIFSVDPGSLLLDPTKREPLNDSPNQTLPTEKYELPPDPTRSIQNVKSLFSGRPLGRFNQNMALSEITKFLYLT